MTLRRFCNSATLFLKEGNRVNVALSRARHGLIIVLNTTAIQKNGWEFRRTALLEIKELFASMNKSVVHVTKRDMRRFAGLDGLDVMASDMAGIPRSSL